ncbi:unnamed protein product [Lathyrus oleraceus]
MENGGIEVWYHHESSELKRSKCVYSDERVKFEDGSDTVSDCEVDFRLCRFGSCFSCSRFELLLDLQCVAFCVFCSWHGVSLHFTWMLQMQILGL